MFESSMTLMCGQKDYYLDTLKTHSVPKMLKTDTKTFTQLRDRGNKCLIYVCYYK